MTCNSLTVLLGLLAHLSSGSDTIDLTKIPGTIGEDVVDATINQIKDSCVFQNDYLLLKRLAFVESTFGTNAETYRAGYDGGIWQVDRSLYEKTMLRTSFDDIEDAFGIDWTTTTWSDLRKPLFSAIAMMLLMEPSSEPKTISEQGEFYKTRLNGLSNFNALVSNMPAGCLSDNLDMAFLIDASGSIRLTDWVKSKEFVAEVLNALTIDSDAVRVAVTTFSTNVNTHVYFKDRQDKTSLQQTITDLPFDRHLTNTGLALEHLIKDVFTEANGMRAASAKIAIIQTDGRSQGMDRTLQAAQQLREKGVTLFAIGVGNNVNDDELNGIATSPTCRHIRKINDFEELHSIVSDIDDVACKAIIDIRREVDTDFTCIRDVTIRVQIADGKTIVVVGDVTLFGSFDIDRPSSALHSFSLDADSALPTMIYLPPGEILSITFGTRNCTGDFVVQVLEGNQLKKTGTATFCSKTLLDGTQELQKCKEIDYVTSNTFTTDDYAQSFCACTSQGYHAHPDTTMKYIYCDVQESYTVDCPIGFAYVQAHEDCSSPASTAPDGICDICTASNMRIKRLAFPLATNGYQYVECSDVNVCELKGCAFEFLPAKQTCKYEVEISAFCRFLRKMLGYLPSFCCYWRFCDVDKPSFLL